MGVTQYIGSRYVPVFADPADWNNTRAYEPLTIVLHEGNSYTSKQYVPKGVDISNADFWAETGNYNSQVEQYRKEVLALDGRVTTNANGISSLDAQMAGTQNSGLLNKINGNSEKITANENAIKSYLNLADYIDNFNGGNLNDAFSKALADYPDATHVVIPAGNYVITETIDLTKTKITHLEGTACKIKATATMDYMVQTNAYNTITDGLDLDGNWLSAGIMANTQSTVRNCYIANCTGDYIGGYKQGLHLYNLRLVNPLPREHHDTQGIACGTDALIESVWAWGFRTAINAASNSAIATAYFWNYWSDENCVGIYSTGVLQITNVYFDCINTPIIAKCNVSNMFVYVNGHDIKYNTNPYYKFSNHIYSNTNVLGYYCATESDFDREFAQPNTYIDPSVTFITNTTKTNSNFDGVEFNYLTPDVSAVDKSICYMPKDFTTGKYYKIGEIHHDQYYTVMLMLTSRIENGGILTITDARIKSAQGFFNTHFFNSSSIAFNEENNVLSIYCKMNDAYLSSVQLSVIMGGPGARGVYLMPTAEESTLTSYNRTVTDV